MEDSYWSVQVRTAGTVDPTAHVGAGGVFRVAEWASKANPGLEVWVSGAAGRCRRVYLDGQVVQDFPELSKYYLRVTPAEQHAWKEA